MFTDKQRGLNEHYLTMTSQLQRLSSLENARGLAYNGQYGLKLLNVEWVAWISIIRRPLPGGR